jgi:hypothetical protein
MFSPSLPHPQKTHNQIVDSGRWWSMSKVSGVQKVLIFRGILDADR